MCAPQHTRGTVRRGVAIRERGAESEPLTTVRFQEQWMNEARGFVSDTCCIVETVQDKLQGMQPDKEQNLRLH